MKKFKIKTRPTEPVSFDFSEEMADLIDEAYLLFDHPVKGRLSVCSPCCVSEERMQELIKTPVKTLSLSAIYDYLDAVHYDEEGYEIKHFLPRILELLAMGKDISHSTELHLQRCHFQKPCWSEKELDFMQRFSAKFIENILKINPQRFDRAMGYILMFDLAGLKTAHLLRVWEENLTTPTALEHLAWVLYYDLKNGAYSNVFSVNTEFNQQINDWLHGEHLRQIATAAIEIEILENETLSDDFQYLLSQFFGC